MIKGRSEKEQAEFMSQVVVTGSAICSLHRLYMHKLSILALLGTNSPLERYNIFKMICEFDEKTIEYEKGYAPNGKETKEQDFFCMLPFLVDEYEALKNHYFETYYPSNIEPKKKKK